MGNSADRIAARIGGFSRPAKMPCASYSTPAERCPTGSRLRSVAGTTCSECYARKGCYGFQSTQAAMARRMEAVDAALAEPDAGAAWVNTMVAALRERLALTLRAIKRNGKPGRDDGRCFRWHDSGDLQSLAHLRLIARIAEQTPEVKHWLPTREAGFVRQYTESGEALPRNLVIRLSLPRIGDKVAPVFKRLALHPSVALSGVHNGARAEGFAECKAYKQGGACLDCRACWDSTVNVSYPLH